MSRTNLLYCRRSSHPLKQVGFPTTERYKKLTHLTYSDIMLGDMGDMADMLIEQGFGQLADGDVWGEPSVRKTLRCRQCGKTPLDWRKILDIWVMFEKNGKVHMCCGYEPPIEVLKELAKEVFAETKEDSQWKNLDKAKKRGGLIKLIPVLPDDQLIDLYASFIRDDCSEPNVGMSFSYKKEIALIRGELIQRMSK